MTKLKFFISMIFTAVIFILAVVFSGNSVVLFIDLASLILGVMIPFIIISLIYPLSEQKEILGEVLTSDDPDEVLLKKALAYLNSFKKLLIYSGIIWTIMGGIGIGAHLQGPEALGLNFGVLMIVPLYVSLFLFMVIEPLRGTTEKKLVI